MSDCPNCTSQAEEIARLTEEKERLKKGIREAHDLVSRRGQPDAHDHLGCLIDGILNLKEALWEVGQDRRQLEAQIAELRAIVARVVNGWELTRKVELEAARRLDPGTRERELLETSADTYDICSQTLTCALTPAGDEGTPEPLDPAEAQDSASVHLDASEARPEPSGDTTQDGRP